MKILSKFLAILIWMIGNIGTVSSKTENKIIERKGIRFVKSFGSIDEYQLDNGFRVLLKLNKEAPLFSWQVWYRVGSRNEQTGLTGIAHYLEHIMFKGTQNLRKGEIAQLIQLQGGIFNAFTSDDYTAYYENFSPENLELAIKIEADRMQNSRLDNEEINLERSVIVSELEGNKNDPYNVLYETLRANAFEVHSYRNPVIGWRKDLDNINAKNMREFYERFYYPDNALGILAGNFDPDLALNLIVKYFGSYKARGSQEKPIISVEPEHKAEKRITIHNEEGAVKLLGIAFQIPEFNSKDTAAIHLLSTILFDGMSSRLYSKLVDSGLATGFSGVAESAIDPSILRIIVNISEDADIKEVEQIIYSEIESIKSTISDEELELAKAKEESNQIYQRDGVHEEALQIGYFNAVSHDWTTYITWLDSIRSVCKEDIKRVANQYLTNQSKTVVTMLPGKASPSLSLSATPEPSRRANYGAGALEPLNPQQLTRLVKIAEPKFSKNKNFPANDFKFKAFSLDKESKIKVLLKEDHSLPLTYINLQFYAGSAAEGEKEGLAFLTSQLLDTGSKSMDKYEIAKLTDLYGSEISFNSGIETAKISVSSISKNLKATLDILKDILQNPAFSQKELDILKSQSLAKLKQEDDFISRVSRREISQLVYPQKHPYYISDVQTRTQAIESITVDEIKKFYSENYNPHNLLISAVGDISQENLIPLLKDVCENWNTDGKGNSRPQIPLTEIKTVKTKEVLKPGKKQTEIILGHASPIDRGHKDFYPLLIANYALGGSPLSSRLGAKVRDEFGYVYNIRSSFSATIGAGMFNVSLGCNPANKEKAIDLSKQIIKDFLKEGISPTELKVATSYLKGSFAVRSLSSNDEIAETLSQIQLYNLGLDYIDNYKKMIDSITLESVNEAARKYINPEKLNTVIVGP